MNVSTAFEVPPNDPSRRAMNDKVFASKALRTGAERARWATSATLCVPQLCIGPIAQALAKMRSPTPGASSLQWER